jgi:hypothetical protein
MGVDSGHDYRQCDNGDGKVCPECQFKQRLCDLIARAAQGSERKWDAVQGRLVDRMFDATYALHRTRRERFTDEHDEIANSWEAANMLVQLFAMLNDLRVQVINDPSLSDGE